MKFTIYHAVKGNFFADNLPKESYTKVAIVEAESLDDAYNKTQNIDSSWVENRQYVTCLLDKCRSTSVGDIIYNTEEKQSYMVANIGFEKVNVFK